MDTGGCNEWCWRCSVIRCNYMTLHAVDIIADISVWTGVSSVSVVMVDYSHPRQLLFMTDVIDDLSLLITQMPYCLMMLIWLTPAIVLHSVAHTEQELWISTVLARCTIAVEWLSIVCGSVWCYCDTGCASSHVCFAWFCRLFICRKSSHHIDLLLR